MIALLVNCAYLSETSRMLQLRRALLAEGADVSVATHGGAHVDLLAAEGVEPTMLEPHVSAARGRQLVADGPGIGARDQSMWTDDEIRACALAEAAYLRDVGATVVATGFQLPALLSSRLAGIPLATSHAGSWVPPILEHRMMPAMGEAGPPLPGWLPERAAAWLTNVVSLHMTFYTAGFNRVADELGVERVPTFAALMCGDLTLVTEAPEVLGIDPAAMHAWRPGRGFRPSTRMAYAGPMYAQLDLPVPPEVDEFLDGPDDVAYVALTSTDRETVLEAIAGVRAAGRRALVASTLHDLDVLQDEDVLAVPFLPSHRIMPRCEMAVIAGGQGSVQTALATGTPFAALPLQGEQVWNVHVAERLGAAVRLSRSTLRDDVTTAVARIAEEGSHRAAASRVASIYAAVDGPARAAAHVLDLATRRDGRVSDVTPRHARRGRHGG